MTRLQGCPTVGGKARGAALVTNQPISFWGGVSPVDGAIIDPRHELLGQSVAGRVLAFPYGKGSSTTSLIILELVRVGKAPAAIVNIRTEPILATGPVAAKHFYDHAIPIVCLTQQDFNVLRTSMELEVDGDSGTVTIVSAPDAPA